MNTGIDIAILTATPLESAELVQRISNKSVSARGVLTGTLGNSLRVAHMNTGIGPVNAALGASAIINFARPAIGLVLFGIGGAFIESGLGILDTASATEEVYADFGVITDKGQEGLDLIGIPIMEINGNRIYNRMPIIGPLAEKAAGVCKASGTFATVASATGTDERARMIFKQYSAICENMEGAAVAHTCLREGIHMAEIRGISNMVERRDVSKWDIKGAAHASTMAALELLDTLHSP